MNENFYRKMLNFINSKFEGDVRSRMVQYLNSDLFRKELRSLMNNQRLMGERLSLDFAGECLLEAQATREEDEDIII